MELLNKTAIVCGSTNGIGKAIAHLFAANGCNLALFTHNETKLKIVKNELEYKFGVNVDYLVANFDDANQVGNAISNYLSIDNRKIDILVYNVKGSLPSTLCESNSNVLREVFERHIISNYVLTMEVKNNMIKYNTKGRIINICANTSLSPYPNLGLSSIRASEIYLAKTLSIELSPYNITVNNILPGATDTDGLKDIIRVLAQKEGVPFEIKNKQIMDSLPLKRYARPDEIAQAALFLALDTSTYITGSNITVDGGFNTTIS